MDRKDAAAIALVSYITVLGWSYFYDPTKVQEVNDVGEGFVQIFATTASGSTHFIRS